MTPNAVDYIVVMRRKCRLCDGAGVELIGEWPYSKTCTRCDGHLTIPADMPLAEFAKLLRQLDALTETPTEYSRGVQS